jgi:hypothetical protein
MRMAGPREALWHAIIRAVSGTPRPSDESHEVAFFSPAELADLDMHPSIRLRLSHHSEQRPGPVIA